MHRRDFLAATAAASLGLGLPRVTFAAAHGGGAPAIPAARKFRVGEMTVTALNDGFLHIGPEALSGIDAAGYDELMRAAFRDPETYPSAVNAFLIESGDLKIMVDAGTGGAMGDTLGKLPMNLAGAGIDPAQITHLVATHLHPDHVGGAVLEGSALFPNAELVVSETERGFWMDDSNFDDASQGFKQIAQGVLSAYGDRLSPFSGETEIAPGITSMPLPGHTPGHSGFMLTSGDDALLIWADIVHVPPVQFARPPVTIGFDVDPAQAAETRARILDRAAADRLMVAGSHMTFPGLANITPDGDGFRAVEANYDYQA
ncbi:MBL fold metallo-hydrolase [Anianabacter salinae]|uniref:MBL fold metallo-hydrolase n=1 Tax=Anianabacter salinae TaxID=2851023 RepID=UPI00225E1BEB|nr:MBL fold metallo-hydrolase [Anianabacter salinae]MBV0911005.1 MBL fold metallo-hydrolase [Anianabacter salinae]